MFDATGYTPEEEAAILWGDMSPDQQMDALASLDEESNERWELLQMLYAELLKARDDHANARPYPFSARICGSEEEARVGLTVLGRFIDMGADRAQWITRKAAEIETGRAAW